MHLRLLLTYVLSIVYTVLDYITKLCFEIKLDTVLELLVQIHVV